MENILMNIAIAFSVIPVCAVLVCIFGLLFVNRNVKRNMLTGVRMTLIGWSVLVCSFPVAILLWGITLISKFL